MKMISRIALVAVLVLPLLVPGLLWLRAAENAASGPVWHIKIAGFDPRDLLHGRYIEFTYDWNITKDDCTSGDCCLCIYQGNEDPFNPTVRRMECNDAALPTCVTTIPELSAMARQRAYIPEQYADALDRLVRTSPQRFSIAITMPPGHSAPVNHGLLLDHLPLKYYLRRHGVAGLE